MSQEKLQIQIKQLLVAVQSGQFQQAKILAERPEIQRLNEPQVLHARAMTYLNLAEIKQARALFIKLLLIIPTQHAIHNVVADLSAKLGDYALAQQHFQQATSQSPNTYQYWFNWGLCCVLQKQYEAAVRYFQTSLELQPSFTKARIELAKCLVQRSEFSQAEMHLEVLFEHYAEHVSWQWHYLMGQCVESQGLFDKAMMAYKNAMSFKDNEYIVYEALALLSLKLNAVEDALDWLQKGLESFPLNPQLNKLLSNLKFEMADKDPLANYKKLAKSNLPVELQQDYIGSLISQNQIELAKENLRQFTYKSQNEPCFSGLKCEIALREKRFEDVLSLSTSHHWSKNAAIAKAEYEVLAHFGLGHYEQAEVSVDELLRTHPTNQYYWALKSTALKLTKSSMYEELMNFHALISYCELFISNDYRSVSDFNQQLLEVLAGLHTTVQNPLNQSGVGGTQTPGFLFDHKVKVLQDLELFLLRTTEHQLSKLQHMNLNSHPVLGRYQERLKIVTAWSMWLKTGGFHKFHCHPKGWYSSAYYVQTPCDNEANSTAGNIAFGQPGIDTLDPLMPDKYIKPKAGYLALFPSFFWHGTLPFSEEQARVSVAFDILPQNN